MGYESLEDEPRSGGPIEVTTQESIDTVEDIVPNDRRLRVWEIAKMSGLSDTTVRRILHEHLGMKKVSARWVPKLLSVVQKQYRVDCARSFLKLCEGQQKKVLQSIVTGDETMVLYHDPLSKRESMEWRFPGEPPPRKAKVTQSSKKIMATIFWDCEGILLIDFKERNTTVNATYYASLLHELRASIREKRPGKLTRGVRLLHDNAPVHTAWVAQAAIRDCGFEQLDHPPYSPDLAPSDYYYLFSKLKKDCRGKRFTTDEEVQSAVLHHFRDKDSNYFLKVIELLVKRCLKCIEVNGDYVEK